jgi:hypothetical protein
MRADLLAALAASRELGPEMDQALVESYLQKRPLPAKTTPARTRTERGVAPYITPALGSLALLLPAAIVVATIVASGGHALWLLWILWLPFFMRGWWWRRWPQYRVHDSED